MVLSLGRFAFGHVHLGDHCAPVSRLAEKSEKLMVLTQATVMPMVADFPYYRWLSPREARREIVLDVLGLQKPSSLSLEPRGRLQP